jgi:hypothetical protein
MGRNFVMLEEDAGDGAVGKFMRVLAGVLQASGTEFPAEGGGGELGMRRHVATIGE